MSALVDRLVVVVTPTPEDVAAIVIVTVMLLVTYLITQFMRGSR